MFQKQIMVTTKLIENQKDSYAQASAMKKLAWLGAELSNTLHTAPSMYDSTDGEENTVYMLFENSCIVCDELFAEYGEIIASIAKAYPISICGMLESLEMGELTANIDAHGLHYIQSNISGLDYDILSSIYIKIVFKEQEAFDLARILLSDCAKISVAFPRKFKRLLGEGEYWGEREVTHFLYLCPSIGSEFSELLPEILSIPQLVELWKLFLDEGISAVEFDMIYEQIKVSESSCLLRLELALQLAVNELSIVINNDTSGFTVFKESGERIKLDFRSNSAAEKLFVKILFPVNR